VAVANHIGGIELVQIEFEQARTVCCVDQLVDATSFACGITSRYVYIYE